MISPSGRSLPAPPVPHPAAWRPGRPAKMTGTRCRIRASPPRPRASVRRENGPGAVFPTNARTERRPRSSDCGETRFTLVPGGLGHLHGHRARGRVDALGFGAVGIAPPPGVRASSPAPRQRSRSRLASPVRRRGRPPTRCHQDPFRSAVPGSPPRAVSLRLSIRSSPWLVCSSMEYQNGQPLPGRAPAGAHGPLLKRISRPEGTVSSGLHGTPPPLPAAAGGRWRRAAARWCTS